MKRILLFTTGGTIASKEGNKGLEPGMNADELLSYMGDLTNRYQITCRELLSLDSSNIQAEEWKKIARNVFDNLEHYDGIVVTHGTDTMAYTASILSFMLQNLPIPVVLTGSQMPIDNMLTDARNNLYAAFAAIDAGISGVSVAFNRRIMLGCRAVKVRTLGFEAFESVNAPYLAEVFANGMRRYHEPEKPVPAIFTNSADGISADFNSADFNSADFNSADFSRTDFNSADFNSADFNRTDFNSADFNRTDFNSADFSSEDISSEDFSSMNSNSMDGSSTYGNTYYGHPDGIVTAGRRPALLKDHINTDVFLLKLIPNTKPSIFDALKSLGYKGIVLEAFGAGGLHFFRRNLLEKLEQLTRAGISVVACSQCLYEPSDFSMYEVGRRLLECGVIPGRDMTTEAAVTKLMWALGQTEDSDEVRRIFNTDIAGEVSITEK